MNMRHVTVVTIAVLLLSIATLADAAKTVVTWSPYYSLVDRGVLFNNLANQYMELHPDIEIKIVVPTTSYYPALQTWLAAGTGPDVMWLGQSLWSFTDMLLPLNDLVAKDANVGSIHKNIMSMVNWNGSQIGLPYGVNTNVMAYNKGMFDSAGAAYPTTSWLMPDLVSLGKKITKDLNGDSKPDKWAISPYNFYHNMAQGGDFYTADMRKVDFVNPASIAATQFTADLVSGKYGICHAALPSAQRDPYFYDENTSMYVIGTFSIPAMRKNAKFDWDVVEFPGVMSDGKRYDSSFVSLESWSVNKDSKSLSAAVEFVRWLLQPDAMKQITELGVIIPTQAKHATQFMNQAAPPKNLSAYVNTLNYTHRLYFDHPAGATIGTTFLSETNPVYKGLRRGEIPAASALPELQRLINAYLDEWWAKR